MRGHRPLILVVLLSTLGGAATVAADNPLPPGDKEPAPRIDPGGPGAFVTSLAFSSDGKTLYAAGWDKVIRVWTLNDKGEFKPSRTMYRVPAGPGVNGTIDALALSPDGHWLAAAGNGMARQTAGFRDRGFIVPSEGVSDPDRLQDFGNIYLFSTRDQAVRILRGHEGNVTALTFGHQPGKASPRLLSVATEAQEGGARKKQLIARLWDLDKRTSIKLPVLPKESLGVRRPGVALWESGPGMDKLQAAFALYDRKLRVCDVAQEMTQPRKYEDLWYNLALAYLDPGQLLTAGYNSEPAIRQSQLTRWGISAKGELEQRRQYPLGDGFARALIPLSRKGDNPADLAAVVMWQPGSNGATHEYRLRIVDLDGEKTRELAADLPLWEDPYANQPVLAAARGGEYLAVAGNQNHTIWIYPVRDFVKGKKPQPKILKGDALVFQHVSFVHRGKNLGLLLNPERRRKPRGAAPPQPDARRGDWIFDFSERSLSDKPAGWETAAPRADGWTAKDDGKDDGKKGFATIAIHHGEELVGSIVFPKGGVITDYALAPPGEAATVPPLLAVAIDLDGQPILTIYNAKSGEPVRRLTGHEDRIAALAFSPDGQLLVSTAEDRTVCVWSLRDLNTVLDKRGRLKGLTVGQANEAVRVLEVEADSPAARAKLKRGDILAGLVQKGKCIRRKTPADFYEAIFYSKPGLEVILRRGDPNGHDDISLVVDQGIDERKPLFSLFVSQGEKAADCEWIGWRPVGPYDASEKAERYLRWHFNTGDPKAPTRSARADQYRPIFYQKGLLKQLIENRVPGGAEIKLPAPTIALWVEEKGRAPAVVRPAGGMKDDDHVVVRHPEVDFIVTLGERPLSSLSALTWRLDDGAEKDLLKSEDPEGGQFSETLPLKRGRHRFEVKARTLGFPSEEVREWLDVVFQPEPPKVVYKPERPQLAAKDAGGQIFVDAPAFPFTAQIEPKLPHEEVCVTLRHWYHGQEVKADSKTEIFPAEKVKEGEPLDFKQQLTLLPGENEIKVEAVYSNAPADGREEPGLLSLSIFYFKAKPPEIAFEKVNLAPEKEGGELRAVDPSRPVVVSVLDLRLLGTIKADKELLREAQLDQLGRGVKTRAKLSKFEPDKKVTFEFDERIKLEAHDGAQTIRIRAKTKSSDEAECSLTFQYRPPLPVVNITQPRDGQVFPGPDDKRTISLRGKLEERGARGYDIDLLVNGKLAPKPDVKAGTLSGEAVVEPGPSILQVRVSNKWETKDYPIAISFTPDPPTIQSPLKYDPVKGEPLLNLEAKVISPIKPEPASVRVEVNGRETAGNEKATVKKVEGEKNLWIVRLRGVPLDAHSPKQEIALSLSHTYAKCREPGRCTVELEKVFPPPEAEFLEPRVNTSVSTAQVMVRFRVRSTLPLPLVRVRLLQEGQPDEPVDVREVPKEGDKYVLTGSWKVKLRPGPNRLSLEAVSLSGRLPNNPQLVLTYVPPPFHIDIKHVTENFLAGPAVSPLPGDRSVLVFSGVTSGRVWLHGQISWADKQVKGVLLRSFVNGFQQAPVEVKRQGGEAQTLFEVGLLLNRKDNRVRLAASPCDDDGATECTIDCAKPFTRQNLYVLALSTRSQPDQLRKQLQNAFNTQRAGAPAKAFPEPIILEPLTGDKVHPHDLNRQLKKLEREMAVQRGRDKLMNDVLIIYYEGGETINEDGHFFCAPGSAGPADPSCIPCDKLVRYLSDLPGAHVLLLDVERSARAEVAQDRIVNWKARKDSPQVRTHVAVMRCALRPKASRPGGVRLLPVVKKTIQAKDPLGLGQLIALVKDTLEKSEDAGAGLLIIGPPIVPPELVDLKVGSSP
jgi:WD40 repeat protein